MLSQDRLLGADRPNRHASQLARAKHFENNLASMEKNLTDAQAAMEELLKDTPAFTHEQRKSMAEAITSFMDSSVEPTTASCKSQNHPYLHHYMTDTIWKQLRDKGITWPEKKEAFIDFSMERIGLRYPNNDTLKLMLSIMWNAAEATLSPDDAYQELHSLHEIFVNKRPIITGRVLMQEYDRDVSQFTRLYPHQFLQCDPPVASQIDDRKLQQKMRRDIMPSRNTNTQLKEKSAPQPRQAGAPDMQSMLLQFVLGQMQGLPHMGSHARSSAPRQPRALTDGQLALTDGQPEQEQRETLPHIPPAAREAAPADAVRAIVDQAKQVIRRGGQKTKKSIKKDKGTKKAMKKHKKKSGDDDEETPDEEEEHEEQEDEEEDEEPESEEETDDDDIMKRPSAVSKRPAADLHKKPAGNRPKPVFDEPLHWGGGRVYYSASKRAWRVYKRASDKVESTVSVNAESASNIKTQWQKVLNAIENDPRPS